MQKLSALLPALITTTLNAILCYAINRFPVEEQFANQLHPLIVVLTIVSVIGIAFFTNPSSTPPENTETTNHAWVIGFLPLIGSAVLFGLLKTNQLSSDLTKYADIGSLILFVLGTLLPAVLLLLQVWQSRKTLEHGNFATTDTLSIQRVSTTWQALLKAVKSEVEDRLAQSLHSAVLLNLGKESQPQQVNRPWDVEVKIGQQQSYQLASETKIIDIFNNPRISGKLLILGEPGSGKTTTLLELARDLISLAENNTHEAIPVLFNLSSWKEDNQTIADWLIAELKLKYGLRVDIGKQWLDEHKLLPLLDGLDELEPERQEICVQAINQFLISDSRPSQLVVCSRTEEYVSYDTMLALNGAISLKPLNKTQIQEYLATVELTDLWESLKDTPEIVELISAPLILSMTTLAYESISIEKWQENNSPEKFREYLFNTYIKRMMERRITSQWYTKNKEPLLEKTLHWLSYLASQLKEKSTSDFLLENIRADWLRSTPQKETYQNFISIGHGLMKVLILGLFLTINGEGIKSLRNLSAFFFFLFFFGMKTGREVGKTLEINLITLKQKPWILNWNNISLGLKIRLIISVVIGLAIGLYKGLIEGITAGLTLGIVALIIVLLIEFIEFSESEIETTTFPNQGIFHSAINAIVLAMIAGIIFVGVDGLLAYVRGMPIEPIKWLSTEVLLVLYATFMIPSTQQHFTLRVILWSNGYIPWNYARFLNYATERMFLQRIGGRYRFMHKFLQEHFAQMEPNQQLEIDEIS